MGKLRVFDILLDNAQGVFFASQHITGHLYIELDAPMQMREIRLTFQGLAYVYWSEYTGTGSDRQRRSYTATEYYFHQIVPLYGLGMGTGEMNTLPQGQHRFPFTYILPPSLPSSFEGTHGHVRYTIRGTIDKPWKFNYDVKRPFTVVALLDLNLQPNASSSVQSQASKNLCCLCCKSGPITGLFRVERVGYVPGECINFQVEIQNFSKSTCNMNVILYMITKYHAETDTEFDKKGVARVIHDEVGPGDTETWSGGRLVIPPLPPSFLVGCRIIDINYFLELTIYPSGPSLNLVVPLEVVIGTIPLNTAVQQHNQQQEALGYQAAQSQRSYPPGGASSSPSAPEIPPPTYNECVMGQANIRDAQDTDYTRGDMSFTPKYTYYSWN